MEGFPDIDPDRLQQITDECTIREATLLPKLRKTVSCGINRGNDRYWEFALDPVFDVALISTQVEILKESGLIPGDTNSLHITLGDIKTSRYVYYIAMVMEALSCTPERITTAFPNGVSTSAKGWARKGYAGVYQKRGTYDMQYGYYYGAEIRLAQVPGTVAELHQMLDIAQRMAVQVDMIQRGVMSSKYWFDTFISHLASILHRAGLPDSNWRNPHMNPDVWEVFVEALPSMKQPVLDALKYLDNCKEEQCLTFPT